MRLMLITHSYLPESTPPQRRWTAFADAFRRQGWEVDVIAPPPDTHHTPPSARPDPASRSERRGARRGSGGERIRRTWALPRVPPTRTGRFLGHIVNALAAVPVALAAPRPDVVVVTLPALPMAVTGLGVAWLRRVPLVVEMRDAWPDLARESGVSPGLPSRLMETIVTGAQRQAALVVTVTEGFAQRLRERGIASVQTVGNGVTVEAIDLVPARDRAPGELNVLYLGNHGESQGLETVIQAAALARDSGADIRVRMVGDGTQKPELTALNQALGSPVQMLEAVYGPEVRTQYAWADTCVVALRPDWPSFEWTVPSKAYELMASGLHVTGVVTGEAAQVLEGSGAARIVPADAAALREAWTELAADPALTQVGLAGREWTQRHADLPELGQRYVEVVRSVISGRLRRGAAPEGRPLN